MQLRKNFSDRSVKDIFQSEDLGCRDTCWMATERIQMRNEDASKALTGGVKRM